MKDTKLIIPKSDLEIIIAKFYRLKDVTIEDAGQPGVVITANYPKKRRKK
jgi:hypothetical protein